MIIKDKLNFKIKKKIFEIKRIKIKDISIEYIKSLNVAAYLKFKKKHTLNSQSNYLKKINNSRNNFIVGIFHKEKLVGTMNTQTYKKLKIGNKKFKNIVSFGILIFLKYQKKKIGKFSIKNFSNFLKKKYDYIFSTINKKNQISINAFMKAGFKKMNFKKNDTLFYLYKN